MVGLIAAPLALSAGGHALRAPAMPALVVVAIAGLLVGFGTRLGSGCTSGHGICGIARLSPRSIAATADVHGRRDAGRRDHASRL